jgi:large subunit ribosomal protein L23
MKDLFQVIKTIRLSEKATFLGEINNEFVFQVDRRANKLEMVDVRTANYRGKKRRERRADFGRTPHWKKAIVRLAEGETIDLV